ncbi:MAG: hypothetical protein QX198_02090 [Methylococcaceae bacterium]
MSNQDELNKENGQRPFQSSTDTDSTLEEGATSPLKAMLVGICFLGVVFSIFTLLPMFFTLLSDGDFRAPAEIHPNDSAVRLSHQASKPYAIKSPAPIANEEGRKAPINAQNAAKKFSNNVE